MALPVLLLVVVLVQGGATIASVKSSKYTNAGLNDKTPTTTTTTTTSEIAFESPARSKVQCAVLCNQHDCCETFTFDRGVCRGHTTTLTSHTPSVNAPGSRSYVKEGKTNMLQGRTQRPEDCGDVHNSTNESGIYTIYVNNTPVNVYCDMDTDGGGWTVLQRRQDGSVNFTRHYTEFEAGFGDVCGEFWLGLRHMQELTSQARYELRVDMEDFEHNTTYALYNSFSLADATDNYRLRLGSLVTGPSYTIHHMSYNNGQQFSALGNDNSYSSNCVATRRGTAWWFYNCTYVNPNGVYAYRYNTGTQEEAEGTIIWDSFRSKVYSLKRIEMKVRKCLR